MCRWSASCTTLGRGLRHDGGGPRGGPRRRPLRFYTYVSGVFSADPRIVPTARKLPRISFEEMLEIAATGGRVLALRSVEFARNHHVTLLVRSSFTWEPGTLITEEDPTWSNPSSLR